MARRDRHSVMGRFCRIDGQLNDRQIIRHGMHAARCSNCEVSSRAAASGLVNIEQYSL